MTPIDPHRAEPHGHQRRRPARAGGDRHGDLLSALPFGTYEIVETLPPNTATESSIPRTPGCAPLLRKRRWRHPGHTFGGRTRLGVCVYERAGRADDHAEQDAGVPAPGGPIAGQIGITVAGGNVQVRAYQDWIEYGWRTRRRGCERAGRRCSWIRRCRSRRRSRRARRLGVPRQLHGRTERCGGDPQRGGAGDGPGGRPTVERGGWAAEREWAYGAYSAAVAPCIGPPPVPTITLSKTLACRPTRAGRLRGRLGSRSLVGTCRCGRTRTGSSIGWRTRRRGCERVGRRCNWIPRVPLPATLRPGRGELGVPRQLLGRTERCGGDPQRGGAGDGPGGRPTVERGGWAAEREWAYGAYSAPVDPCYVEPTITPTPTVTTTPVSPRRRPQRHVCL